MRGLAWVGACTLVAVAACGSNEVLWAPSVDSEAVGVGGSSAGGAGAGGAPADVSSSSAATGGGGGSAPLAGGGGGGGEGGESGIPCASASTCPGVSNECQQRACVAGYCEMSYAAAGKALAEQEAGDCATAVCDGKGGFTTTPALADSDDGNPCTADSCTPNGAEHKPLAKGAPCPANICDGQGKCVKSLPIVCKGKSGNTYTCPGPDGPNGNPCDSQSSHLCWLQMEFQDGNAHVFCYAMGGTSHPWCPPGTACKVNHPEPWPDEMGVCQ